MTDTVLIAQRDFVPESVRRSWHATVSAGDRLKVVKEHDHGTMTDRDGVPIFLTEEEVYRHCKIETAVH